MTKKTKEIGDRYQEETKYHRDSLGGGFGPAERTAPFKEYPDAQSIIPVPALPETGPAGFWETVARRRSERDFTAETLTLQELALLLFAVQGVTAKHGGYLLRTSPSAGALYPVETYLLVNNVESVAGGVYHYNIIQNSLELITAADLAKELTAAALGQRMVADSAVTFIWTGIPGRSKWKYHERAYRYIYLDAGHIGQNLYLAATALGMGCCTIGAFFDEEVNSIIGVDGKQETAVYMGVVGKLP